ncbi:hypothetical protein FISHEDRAFT_76604 [Fistulina hepatica ATCC 64428]|uniref:ER membrane protein complex subunit 7 beta-sandwich domain-containing protein n=1 Tax=Fistulina hepatica ATCC 64428 TaxID=1128425 RepID=A0A0D7A3P8_9AGAR|nr:hypothetical protein FISHEDRAFT_76604 [Fistulina hepatica ATCC 64428]
MRTMIWVAWAALQLSGLAAAVDVRGSIQFNAVCPGIDELGPSKVVLDSGKYYGTVTKSGRFTIQDVPEGSYILSVLSHDHQFDTLRVDIFPSPADDPARTVSPEVRPYIVGTPFDPPSTVRLSHPIVLVPRQKYSYFIPLSSFNLWGMLKSPMVLLSVGAGGMMLLMPYLMASKNMDPEALNELKQQQVKMAGFQSAMASGDFKSGLSNLLSDSAPAAPPSPPPPQVKHARQRKKKN